MLKTCKPCGATKPVADYYANDNTCKECRKSRVRANRAAKLNYYRDYDRKRSNKAERVAARRAYAETEIGKMKTDAAKKKWADANQHKRKAHCVVSNALRDGKLIRQPCEICKTTEKVQAHHDDYSKPLEIRWLCTTHHAEHHKQEREELRAAS